MTFNDTGASDRSRGETSGNGGLSPEAGAGVPREPGLDARSLADLAAQDALELSRTPDAATMPLTADGGDGWSRTEASGPVPRPSTVAPGALEAVKDQGSSPEIQSPVTPRLFGQTMVRGAAMGQPETADDSKSGSGSGEEVLRTGTFTPDQGPTDVLPVSEDTGTGDRGTTNRLLGSDLTPRGATSPVPADRLTDSGGSDTTDRLLKVGVAVSRYGRDDVAGPDTGNDTDPPSHGDGHSAGHRTSNVSERNGGNEPDHHPEQVPTGNVLPTLETETRTDQEPASGSGDTGRSDGGRGNSGGSSGGDGGNDSGHGLPPGGGDEEGGDGESGAPEDGEQQPGEGGDGERGVRGGEGEVSEEPAVQAYRRGAASVCYLPGGIKVDRNPDAQVNASVEYHRALVVYREEDLEYYNEEAPNLNDSYAEVLETAAELLARQGLTLPPTTILSPKDFGRVKILGEVSERLDGYHLNGKSYIKEEHMPRVAGINLSPAEQEARDRQTILTIILHEAGHRTAEGLTSKLTVTHYIPTGELDSDGDPVYGSNTRIFGVNLGNFRKVDTRGGRINVKSVGIFLDEGMANYVSYRGREDGGMGPRLADGMAGVEMFDGIRFVGSERQPGVGRIEEFTEIPIKFAQGVTEVHTPNGEVNIVDGSETIAVLAYSMELLETAAPGLYERMKVARDDPAKAKEYIRTINGIRPGLYRELRDLPDTAEGRRRGLYLIQTAVTERAYPRGQVEAKTPPFRSVSNYSLSTPDDSSFAARRYLSRESAEGLFLGSSADMRPSDGNDDRPLWTGGSGEPGDEFKPERVTRATVLPDTMGDSSRSGLENDELSGKPTPPARRLGATAVHFMSDGIKVGRYFRAATQKLIDERGSLAAERQRSLDEYIGSAPNLNQKYAADLALVAALLEQEGLPMPPTVVLDAETFNHAQNISFEGRTEVELGGFHSGGKSYITEFNPSLPIEATGHEATLAVMLRKATLMLMLHEAVHYTARAPVVMAVGHYTPGRLRGIPKRPRINIGMAQAEGDLKIVCKRDEAPVIAGSFLSEAYAHYSVVHMLSRIGWESRFQDDEYSLETSANIRYVGAGRRPVVGEADGFIEVPVKFALGAADNEDVRVVIGDPHSMPAYGFELLNDEACRRNPEGPSLYEQMKAAHRNPAQAKEYIRTINSIQPGLYPLLRDVSPYLTLEGFRKGLLLIQQAVAR